MAEAVSALVFDFGSGSLRYGFAGDDAPREFDPSFRGVVKKYVAEHGLGPRMVGMREMPEGGYVGGDAQARRSILSLDYPVKRGLIGDWDVLVLLVNMQKAELAALACGREICLVVDFGAGRTTVTPCYYGYLLNSAASNVHFGGFDLVTYLHRLIIAETGYYLSTSSEFDILRDIQKTVCYVSERRPSIAGNVTHGPSWPDASTTETFILPDGQTLTLSDALRQSSEAIFNPSLLGQEIETCPSLASIILKTVKTCPVDCRAQLLKNIVLVGCPTKLKGFFRRGFARNSCEKAVVKIPYELLEQVHCKIRHHYEERINIVEGPAIQQHAAWLGGSIVASLCDFSQQSGISKRLYDEIGPSSWRKYSTYVSPYSSLKPDYI